MAATVIAVGVLSMQQAAAAAGPSWTVQPSPNARTPQSLLSGVSCSAASACTAVAETAGRRARSPSVLRWNGRTWTTQATAAVPDGGLSAVSCLRGRRCVGVGMQHNLLLSTLAEAWDGASWTVMPMPEVGGTLNAVSCTSATACMATGSGGAPSGATLAESWNGSTWAVVPTPAVGGESSNLDSVSCTSASACTAVGVVVLENGDDQKEVPLAERWNGTGWTVQKTPEAGGRRRHLLRVGVLHLGFLLHRRRVERRVPRRALGRHQVGDPAQRLCRPPVRGVVHLGHGVHRYRRVPRRVRGAALERLQLGDPARVRLVSASVRRFVHVGNVVRGRRAAEQPRPRRAGDPGRAVERGQVGHPADPGQPDSPGIQPAGRGVVRIGGVMRRRRRARSDRAGLGPDRGAVRRVVGNQARQLPGGCRESDTGRGLVRIGHGVHRGGLLARPRPGSGISVFPRLLSERWNGRSWTLLPSRPFLPIDAIFAAVSCTSASVCTRPPSAAVPGAGTA